MINTTEVSTSRQPTPELKDVAQLNVKIHHPIEEAEEVVSLTKLLERQNLSMSSFAVAKKKCPPKIQLDPWGNAYKAPNVPKSKTSKAKPQISPKKKPSAAAAAKEQQAAASQA